jgi:DnaJ family protein C protein 2
MLTLPFGDNEENVVFSGYTACDELRRKIEPAGKYFEEFLQKRLAKFNSFFDEFINPDSNQDVFIEEDQEEYEWEKEYKEDTKNRTEILFSSDKENYYALLGLEELSINSTVDDIRRAYKKMVLLFHPDKNQDNNILDNENESNVLSVQENEAAQTDENGNKIVLTEEEKKKQEINRKWLKIKDAYETLLDPEKKKKYDSTLEFDDTIPEDDEVYDEKNYFKTFGPVFLKNSIWSKRKPVPKIGDMRTPLDKVKRFYQFWYNLDTWRDFSVEGEYNVEDASCRYEKRQMLKENKKLKSSLVKEEKSRLTKLVNIAYKNDPRIKQEEERLRQEREKQKIERQLLKQKEKEDEEERIKQMKLQYEENLRRQKENITKERDTLVECMISLGEEIGINLSKEDKFHINLNGKTEMMKKILSEIQSKSELNDKIRLFKNMTSATMGLVFSDMEKEKENSIWKKDEIFALQKAVKKFPVGTKNRSEKIKEIIKEKSENQIIQMIHFIQHNPNIKYENDFDLSQYLSKKEPVKETKAEPKQEPLKQPEDVWTEDQQKALETALRKHPSTMPLNDRWNAISKDVTGKTKKQCVDRYKYLSSIVNKK